MKCPHCGHGLIQKSASAVKLRVPILVFDLDGKHAVTPCPKCKREIQIPVTLEKSAIPTDPALVLAPKRP